MTSEEELYLCAGCGEAFAADPPDEEHTKPSKKKSDSANVIAVDYDCPSCGVTNAIYWEHPEG
jgi:rubredoxin